MSAAEQDRAFEYLLNAMERAAQADDPAAHGYSEKRRAVFAYVAKLQAAAAAPAADDGVALIAAERRRQIEREGFSAAHDDHYQDNELLRAAIAYAAAGAEHDVLPVFILKERGDGFDFRDPWPAALPAEWDKRFLHDDVRCLAIAGALIAAEIDRQQRAAAAEATDNG